LAEVVPRLLAAFWIAITALSGDLLASRWKRLAGVKDFGQWLPAHGGLLDRFDSFIGVCGFSGVVLLVYDLFAFRVGTSGLPF
jgi:phosphatidate cytidylyltransferase